MEGSSSLWGYGSASGSKTKEMIEQAKEELQILEAQQPDNFNCLKDELKSFISRLESQNLPLPSGHDNYKNSTGYSNISSVSTRESSACKKRKKEDCLDRQVMEDENIEGPKRKFQRVAGDGCSERRNRIDLAIERARECLEKIQRFKTSFC
ncbi:uncharacterized protein LOC113778009 [Coffea eugenioides]|uniref:uncharacterized protein LOC113778009 n=1 Tax=Coffea eugenioides TaxID=49369 RepID=UPI000F60C09D|nr:uncharacterized protein LOC113778009 [Coffea eugenioides]